MRWDWGSFLAVLSLLILVSLGFASNPIVNTMFTADPAVLVYNDSLFVFTGHDEQGPEGVNNKWFLMRDWHVFVTDDMENYHDYGAVLSPATFKWASGNAFAGHCEYANGKFYWYVAVTHKTIKEDEGFSIGVAVADHPSGPWKDAIGSALITDNTPNDIALNIDPAIYFDNGTVWMYWGSWNAARRVKLKSNMIELDGSVETVTASGFFEAPWIHYYRGQYYFSYASGYPSTTNYSISKNLAGPWTNKGILNPLLENSETNHQAIIKYLGHWYFIYHGANHEGGWTYRRSVNIDYLFYDQDGNMQQINRTTTGVDKVNNALLSEGVYNLKVSHSNLLLEDNNGIVQQQTNQNNDQQLWELKPSEKNRRFYTLRNVKTKAFYCPSSTLLDTVRTSQNECEIRIENASVQKGYYLYSNYEDDFVGDILNISEDPGMPLITWVRTGADNQKIQFEYVRDIETLSLTIPKAGIKRIQWNSKTKTVDLHEVTAWSLYDLSGRFISKGISQHINMSHFKSGCYLIKVQGQAFFVSIGTSH